MYDRVMVNDLWSRPFLLAFKKDNIDYKCQQQHILFVVFDENTIFF